MNEAFEYFFPLELATPPPKECNLSFSKKRYHMSFITLKTDEPKMQ